MIQRAIERGGQLLAQHSSGAWQYILPDHLGSVRQVVDANWNLIQSTSYTPFGQVMESEGGQQSAFGFTGEQRDATGLMYLRARYYEPERGVFLSRDTIVPEWRHPQSLNQYAYVFNNPLKYNDPTGHCIGDPNKPNNPDRKCWELLGSINRTYAGIFQISQDFSSHELRHIERALSILFYAFRADFKIMKSEIAYFGAVKIHQNPCRLETACYISIIHRINVDSRIFKKYQNCRDCIEFSIIHEVGHALDYNNRFSFGQHDLFDYVKQVGYECDMIFGIVCDEAPLGYTDTYATYFPGEDLAQTFAYSVYQNTGQYETNSNLNRVIKVPNPERLRFFANIIPSLKYTPSGPYLPVLRDCEYSKLGGGDGRSYRVK